MSESGPTLVIEEEIWSSGHRYVAGVDEAGRGCLAGPVVAAAVLLPRGVEIDGVNDSKLIAAEAREELAPVIRSRALSIGIGICSPEEIDRLNVLWASMEAMRRAAANLTPSPDYLLIDGDRCFPNSGWPVRTVVRGDSLSQTIAAASIIAKVTRDRIMRDLHNEFPAYRWVTNVGYPTPEHYAALLEHGPTPHHRRSFRLA